MIVLLILAGFAIDVIVGVHWERRYWENDQF